MTRVAGSRAFSADTLTVFSLFFWFNRAYRSHPMPHQLEAYKLAEQSKTEYRKWTGAMLVLGSTAVFVAFWTILHLHEDTIRVACIGADKRTDNRYGEAAIYDAAQDKASLAGPAPHRARPVAGAARWRIRGPGPGRPLSELTSRACPGEDPISPSWLYLRLLQVKLSCVEAQGMLAPRKTGSVCLMSACATIWSAHALPFERRQHCAVAHFLHPGLRPRPWLRVRLHRICAARQQQLYQLHSPPSACPA